MNLYFCTDDSHDSGLYVAAESRGKAKRMYCDFAKKMGFSSCDKCPIDCDIRQMPKEDA